MMRNSTTLGVMALVLLSGGCKRHRKTRSQPKSDAFADQIKPIVAQKQMQVLHWPDYADYQPLVQTFYDDRNYEVAWVDDGKPSPQATAFISAFKDAAKKGLNPEDYDASLWDARVAKLPSKEEQSTAQFDAAMTVSVMRYISDLRIGRVNPTQFNFDIDVQSKKYDLPEFVSDNAVDAGDVPKLIASVEPDSEQYRQTEDALGRYLDLAKQQADSGAQPLPTVAKPVGPGGMYPAAGALMARLQLEGDLPGDPAPPVAPRAGVSGPGNTGDAGSSSAPAAAPGSAPVSATGKAKAALAHVVGGIKGKVKGEMHSGTHGAGDAPPTDGPVGAAPVGGQAQPAAPVSTVYSTELAQGVQKYQQRHGIAPDGKLTPQTIASLNVPLSARVRSIGDTLERWRWLPNQYVNPSLMVNLPEFVLRGFGPDHQQQFKMNVVVGKVVGEHQTPVFARQMRYLIFRPYWNLPMSIIKKELAKHLESSGIGYLAAHNYETVDSKGQEVNATAAEVERGSVLVREKPGPKNSLGLIKFMFPNEYDIYLHSTPAPELFNRSRRDFSHGCVRVQHPDQLAVWVLQQSETPGDWSLDQVQQAMDTGPDNHQVNFKNPLPIVIFYATAHVDETGAVDFFDDLYGYDQQLEATLAKGMPYPTKTQPINGNAHPGDTN